MEIIISGARVDERGHAPGVELWRRPFRGWGQPNRVQAHCWCQPERYEVLLGGVVVCEGTIAGPIVVTGESFTLRVERPGDDDALERALEATRLD